MKKKKIKRLKKEIKKLRKERNALILSNAMKERINGCAD